jgi:hypothetical protein
MALAVEEDVRADPGDVRLLGAPALRRLPHDVSAYDVGGLIGSPLPLFERTSIGDGRGPGQVAISIL